jgi:ABC-2 type transport system permease protein
MFFTIGSVYPIQAFPSWLKVIARADPFSYAVDGFKCLLLKETALSAVWPDMLFLSIFAAVTLSIAIPLFKRTL